MTECKGCGKTLVHPHDYGDYDDACEWGCTGCGADEDFWENYDRKHRPWEFLREKYGYLGYGLRKERGTWNEKGWAFSMLSDLQEMIGLKFPEHELDEQINNIKRVLQGKFIEIEDGLMIKVITPERRR